MWVFVCICLLCYIPSFICVWVCISSDSIFFHILLWWVCAYLCVYVCVCHTGVFIPACGYWCVHAGMHGSFSISNKIYSIIFHYYCSIIHGTAHCNMLITMAKLSSSLHHCHYFIGWFSRIDQLAFLLFPRVFYRLHQCLYFIGWFSSIDFCLFHVCLLLITSVPLFYWLVEQHSQSSVISTCHCYI